MKTVLKNFFSLQGRISRLEWLLATIGWTIFAYGIGCGLLSLCNFIKPSLSATFLSILFILYFALVSFYFFKLNLQRARDIGMPNWALMLYVLYYIAQMVLLVYVWAHLGNMVVTLAKEGGFQAVETFSLNIKSTTYSKYITLQMLSYVAQKVFLVYELTHLRDMTTTLAKVGGFQAMEALSPIIQRTTNITGYNNIIYLAWWFILLLWPGKNLNKIDLVKQKV